MPINQWRGLGERREGVWAEGTSDRAGRSKPNPARVNAQVHCPWRNIPKGVVPARGTNRRRRNTPKVSRQKYSNRHLRSTPSMRDNTFSYGKMRLEWRRARGWGEEEGASGVAGAGLPPPPSSGAAGGPKAQDPAVAESGALRPMGRCGRSDAARCRRWSAWAAHCAERKRGRRAAWFMRRDAEWHVATCNARSIQGRTHRQEIERWFQCRGVWALALQEATANAMAHERIWADMY